MLCAEEGRSREISTADSKILRSRRISLTRCYMAFNADMLLVVRLIVASRYGQPIVQHNIAMVMMVLCVRGGGARRWCRVRAKNLFCARHSPKVPRSLTSKEV